MATETKTSFTGDFMKFLIIAGLIVAFATGIIPVVILSSIPIWVWIIFIIIIIFWAIGGKK